MFRAASSKFEERDTQVLGISTDPRPTQTVYSTTMGNIPYPLLSDFHPHGQVAKAYGLLNEERGTARRAVLVVDKEGIVRFKRVYQSAGDIDTKDILAEVDKLQS